MVVTKPLATPVETNQKQVGAFDLLEHFVPALITGKRVAEWAVQAREHRSAQEKILNLFGLTIQHFFEQVIQDKTIIAGKLFN